MLVLGVNYSVLDGPGGRARPVLNVAARWLGARPPEEVLGEHCSMSKWENNVYLKRSNIGDHVFVL